MNSAHSYTEGMDVPSTASKTFLKMCKMRKINSDATDKKTRRLLMIILYAVYIGQCRLPKSLGFV